jgi:hypothetical protein
MTKPQHDEWWRVQSARAERLEPLRIAAGKRINPETADVWFEHGQILDPYGDGGPMASDSEYDCVGRVWFAADPRERVAVWWGDLPRSTAEALEKKRREADAEGWRRIYALRSRSVF